MERALQLLTALEGALRGQGEETDALCAEARAFILEQIAQEERDAPA